MRLAGIRQVFRKPRLCFGQDTLSLALRIHKRFSLLPTGREKFQLSLRHPTVSMPSRDAKSHGTDVPWNGDEEDWPRARDMYHAILRDEFGSDIADTMWYDKVPTDSFDFDVETACLSILNCEKRHNFKLAQSWERDDEFWTEECHGWHRHRYTPLPPTTLTALRASLNRRLG